MGISSLTLLRLLKSTDDQQKDELYSGIALIVFGVGCFSGAYFGGKLCDLAIVKRVAYLGHTIFTMACLLSILVSSIDVLPLSCVACYFWGFTKFFVAVNAMVICSKLFEGKY